MFRKIINNFVQHGSKKESKEGEKSCSEKENSEAQKEIIFFAKTQEETPPASAGGVSSFLLFPFSSQTLLITPAAC